MAKKTNAEQLQYPVGKRENKVMRIAERGQFTIPKEFRDKLGLLPGTQVECRLDNGELRLRKTESLIDIRARIAKVRGIIKNRFPYSSTDEYINEIRGPVE